MNNLNPDLSIFKLGYGQDRIIDGEYNPFRDHIDLVSFEEHSGAGVMYRIWEDAA